MATPKTGDGVPEWVSETSEPQRPNAYREPEPRQYQRDAQDAPCTEAGCTKTLREHIAEARAVGLHGSGILTAMQRRSADVGRPVDAMGEAQHQQRKAEELERLAARLRGA